LVIYFLLKKKPATHSDLIDQTNSNFGVDYQGDKTTENFDVSIERKFKTQEDIVKNINLFCIFAFPRIFLFRNMGMDVNEPYINKLLKKSGSDKTMEQILKDSSTMQYVDFMEKFNLEELMNIYSYMMLVGQPNEKELKQSVVLYHIMKLILDHYEIKQNNIENENVNDVYLQVSPDFKQKDDISIYLRTNLNSQIKQTAAETTDFNEAECVSADKLCKIDINVDDEIETNKLIAHDNILVLNRLFVLLFTLGLLKLDGDKSLLPIYQKELTELYKINKKLLNVSVK
jgi:hypothetical protein